MAGELQTEERGTGFRLSSRVLRALVRKTWRPTAQVALALGFVMGLLSLFVIPKTYEARAVLLPPSQDLLAGAGWLKSLVPGLSEGGTSSEVVMALFQSDRVSWSVIRNLRLDTLWHDTSRYFLLKKAQDRLKVETDLTLGTIVVGFRERDPRLSARIVQEYLRVVEALNDTLKISPIKPFVKVLDPPYPPEKKASPKTTLNVLLTLFLSSLLGFLFFSWRELRRRQVRDPLDLLFLSQDLEPLGFPEEAGALKHAFVDLSLAPAPRLLLWFQGLREEEVRRILQEAVGEDLDRLLEGWHPVGPLPDRATALVAYPGAEAALCFLVADQTGKSEVQRILQLLRDAGIKKCVAVVVRRGGTAR